MSNEVKSFVALLFYRFYGFLSRGAGINTHSLLSFQKKNAGVMTPKKQKKGTN